MFLHSWVHSYPIGEVNVLGKPYDAGFIGMRGMTGLLIDILN